MCINSHTHILPNQPRICFSGWGAGGGSPHDISRISVNSTIFCINTNISFPGPHLTQNSPDPNHPSCCFAPAGRSSPHPALGPLGVWNVGGEISTWCPYYICISSQRTISLSMCVCVCVCVCV